MLDKLWFIIPEITVFLGAVVVSVMGLAKSKSVRDLTPLITCLFLAAGLIVTPFIYSGDRMAAAIADDYFLMPMLGYYVKMLVAGMGIILALLSVGMIDRKLEASFDAGRAPFDPIRVNRGEFYAFFLFSLTGVMLCCSANDLIWLFLALELTSLPTYIMVAMSRPERFAQEAAVKYFFLGAMAAALFLYGFALLYGACGTVILTEMAEVFATQAAEGGVSTLAIAGMTLALLGIAFKIAAFPMHFYAADVYEGAAAPVTAFLGFVPKTAGILAMILLLGTIGWHGHNEYFNTPGITPGITPGMTPGLPRPLIILLWLIAVLTMTLGNVAALLQTSIKRLLAYSSVAHSGYLLIGVIAGPGWGINAVLFYLLAYGLMNTATFAVLAAIERRGEEIETLDDLAGLRERHPALAIVMAVSAFSLIGLPPLLGFVGKLGLLVAGVQADQIILVIIAVINSAISAWYYLKLVGLPIMGTSGAAGETIVRAPTPWPRVAAIGCAIGIVLLPFFAAGVWKATDSATEGYRVQRPQPEHTLAIDGDSAERARQDIALPSTKRLEQ